MKIELIIITTALLSILTTMQTIEESNITPKQSMQEVKVLSTLTPNVLDKKNNTDVLNNKSLSCEKAVSNGNIVEISSPYSISKKTHNNTEIYNINKLDDFMENIKSGKKDKIRIVKYAYEGGRTWVNKLYDLEYNGKKIKYTVYDPYSNPNAFIPSEPSYYDKIIIRDYQNNLWYGICSISNEGDDCATLISFKKSSIVM